MKTATEQPLRLIPPGEVNSVPRSPLDPQVYQEAAEIVRDVRKRGATAVRDYAENLDGFFGESLVLERPALNAARTQISAKDRDTLTRVAARIREFAAGQMRSIEAMRQPVPGGDAGFDWLPVDTCGCYAPGGRYPLVSSVLMTVIPARAAGVCSITLATPARTDLMLAAAAIAGADRVLQVGGAQAIAALAYGADLVPRSDVIVGPGNAWVTAAKHIVSEVARIDMLAGPSELVIIADETASADIIAADLLAQAEHDTAAVPILIATDANLVDPVQASLTNALDSLPTAETARTALGNGYATVVATIDDAIELSRQLAPEHLELLFANADQVPRSRFCCGALFVGENAPEVLGDYGIGPNHTLPTGGSARNCAGLSPFTFLRPQTWLAVDCAEAAGTVLADAERLAEMEGLPGHARAAALRRR